MSDPLRVAFTLEQCWHDVPGGTAVAALEVAKRLTSRSDIDLVGVAGRHRAAPGPGFEPPTPLKYLPLARPWLYETWNRFEWPSVERATGPVDLCHSTTAVPAATRSPHIVTIHDIAFMHSPERFTRHGVKVMTRGLERCRTADLIMCPTKVTKGELIDAGFAANTIRVVPWGVNTVITDATTSEQTLRPLLLPDEFVLFVGTIEPRKNLVALAAATAMIGMPLVVAGAQGWGAAAVPPSADVRFLGHVPADVLSALYMTASVFAYPSLHEGFGLPVLEAMAHGTPVVTSRGTATEEVAGGAAVLINPAEVESIAAGLRTALNNAPEFVRLGTQRSAACSWETTADAIVECYREVVA
ncbi:MAG: glycosyltransferase family 1 protein [Actinomycetota bacterium]|uniref:glycosyltransferase family 4 protein n=1 Tax=uncultured Ilumatobacter sp. TaxID=879968 RepID=UPI00374EC93A|nr:glycosyltransferase family 1 protein [Actinomycetota bacterium]